MFHQLVLPMKKKKDEKAQTIVTYLKVSPYLKGFMERKYGKIVSFPFSSQMYWILYRNIVNNADMKELTKFSYSEYAFDYQQTDSFFVNPTKDADKNEFIAIELPLKVSKGPYEIIVSKYWQLSSHGARELRKLIKEDFMVELFEFIDDCKVRNRIDGYKTTKEQAIDDFLSVNGIDMSYRDDIGRYVRRDSRRIAQKIETRRNILEETSGTPLCYT